MRLRRQRANAAPYDDICHLDLIKVTATEGHDEADGVLADDVFNRTDDYLPPIESERRGAAPRDGHETPDQAVVFYRRLRLSDGA